MADLNEPKKETERIGLPAPAGAKPPTGSFARRPRRPAAPRPLPSKDEVAAGPRPPARPRRGRPHQLRLDAARPPNGPPPPTGAKASVPPPPRLGLNTAVAVPRSAITRRAWTVETGLIADQRSARKSRPASSRPAARDSSRCGFADESDGEAGQRAAGSVPLAPIIRAASPAVANSPAKGLGALAPAQLCWALLGISGADLAHATLELFLLIKSWKILWRSQSTNQILTTK